MRAVGAATRYSVAPYPLSRGGRTGTTETTTYNSGQCDHAQNVRVAGADDALGERVAWRSGEALPGATKKLE